MPSTIQAKAVVGGGGDKGNSEMCLKSGQHQQGFSKGPCSLAPNLCLLWGFLSKQNLGP